MSPKILEPSGPSWTQFGENIAQSSMLPNHVLDFQCIIVFSKQNVSKATGVEKVGQTLDF